VEMIKNIMSFFRKLTPSFEKKRIVDEYKGTIKEMRDGTIRALSHLLPETGGANPAFKELSKRLISKGFKGISANEAMLELAKKMINDEDRIVEAIDKTFNNYVLKEALDYQKLNILHYTNAVAFVNRYMRSYVQAIVGGERLLAGKEIKGPQKMANAFVMDSRNLETFLTCYSALQTPAKDIVKTLEKLRGITVNADVPEKSMGLRQGATDPLKLGFLPVSLNPAYYVGLAWNDWKAACYESAKIEAERTQLELMSLQDEIDGAPADKIAKVEKQIKYLTKHHTKLQAKIQDYEEEAE